jgi:hypothetical protein
MSRKIWFCDFRQIRRWTEKLSNFFNLLISPHNFLFHLPPVDLFVETSFFKGRVLLVSGSPNFSYLFNIFLAVKDS